jgi:hypothetical protein
MNIRDILLIILFIYVIYLHCKISKNKNIENFAVTDDIRAAVKEIYNTDLQAIRNLDKLAQDIQSGGYTINGNLNVTGKLKVDSDISNSWITTQLTNYNNTFQNNYNSFSNNFGPRMDLVEKKTSRMKDHMYFPDGATIYENVQDALNNGSFYKSGNPSGWNLTNNPNNNKWNQKTVIGMGYKNTFSNGIQIWVHGGYTLWVRIIHDNYWQGFTIYNNSGENMGEYSRGLISATTISPDGSIGSGTAAHSWIPCCVPSGNWYYIISGTKYANMAWISGIAISLNPWNHGSNSCLSYHYGSNNSSGVTWNNNNWNGDILAQINGNTTANLFVPNVYSGRDKLVYIIEHNNTGEGGKHESIAVQDTEIERLRATYSNPFARHFNSKPYNRFLAARIPVHLTNSNLLKITIKTGNDAIYFRECGTIDYYP